MTTFSRITKWILNLICIGIPVFLIFMYFYTDWFMFIIDCFVFIPTEIFFLWLLLNYNKIQNNKDEI